MELTPRSCFGAWNQRQTSATKLLARFTHCSQHCLPIFKVRRKNLLDHPMRELRNEGIQRFGRISHLISEGGPIKVIGIPALGHEPAWITHESWERLQIEQLTTIALLQNRVRDAKIPRQLVYSY